MYIIEIYLEGDDGILILARCTGFQWDSHNSEEIRARHGVTPAECEQVFFNQPIIVGDDVKHSTEENRSYLLGRTEARRLLFLVFTGRDELIRVISTRDI